MTKIEGFKMEVPPNKAAKIQTFQLLSWTHDIFKVSKYKRKIKFDQVLGYQNGGPPQTTVFNHTR